MIVGLNINNIDELRLSQVYKSGYTMDICALSDKFALALGPAVLGLECIH